MEGAGEAGFGWELEEARGTVELVPWERWSWLGELGGFPVSRSSPWGTPLSKKALVAAARACGSRSQNSLSPSLDEQLVPVNCIRPLLVAEEAKQPEVHDAFPPKQAAQVREPSHVAGTLYA